MRDEIAQRVTGWFGLGGSGVFWGISVTEIDVAIRILVGVATFISIVVHLYFKVKSEGKNDE